MEYKISKTCKRCKNIDYFPLTKIESAFDIYDEKKLWETPCNKCGIVDVESISFEKPNIDSELLNIWGNNPNYYFMEQDEELIISDVENYNEILKIIDENSFPEYKISVLVESLCTLLYDNIVNDYEYTKTENIERENVKNLILPELQKRKELIQSFSNEIRDYIKIETFPLIFKD